jgi:hypothetical protein
MGKEGRDGKRRGGKGWEEIGKRRGLEDNGRKDQKGWNRMDRAGKERNEKDGHEME